MQLLHDILELGTLGGRDRLDGAPGYQPASSILRQVTLLCSIESCRVLCMLGVI